MFSTVCPILHGQMEIWQTRLVSGELGKMVEHPNQSQHNPGARADGTSCKYYVLHNFPGSQIMAYKIYR